MGLSPEERRKIYEEEKARIEAREHLERERRASSTETSTGLTPNIASMLCYVGGWITGLIFFIIEQTNTTVRFHAAQSILLFGFLTIIGSLVGLIPIVGDVLGGIAGVTAFIFWVVLIVKASNGEIFRLGVISEIAEKMAGSGVPAVKTEPASSDAVQVKEVEKAEPVEEKNVPDKEEHHSPVVNLEKEIGRKIEEYFNRKKSGRIASSAFTIAFSIAALVFFNYFNEYVAFYSSDTVAGITTWTRTPFFTDDISLWLPVLTMALFAAIIGHIILIIFDRYILREVILITIEIFSLASAITLASVFPFDFYAIPETSIAEMVDMIVHIVLICVCVGIGIGIISRGIKLLVNLIRGVTNYESGA